MDCCGEFFFWRRCLAEVGRRVGVVGDGSRKGTDGEERPGQSRVRDRVGVPLDKLRRGEMMFSI